MIKHEFKKGTFSIRRTFSIMFEIDKFDNVKSVRIFIGFWKYYLFYMLIWRDDHEKA